MLAPAVLARTVSDRFPIPAPALFLVAAAVSPVLLPDIRTVERIGVVALIVILFDGGMQVGLAPLPRRRSCPIAALGLLGTFATAGVIAVVAHYAVRLRAGHGGDPRGSARADGSRR